MLAACIRLGDKYGMDHVIDGSVARLESCLPAVFASWEKLIRIGGRIRSADTEITRMDAFQAITLFRLCGRTSSLAVALYICSTSPDIDKRDAHAITPDDLHCCLRGRIRISKNIFRFWERTARHFVLCGSSNCKRRLAAFSLWVPNHKQDLNHVILGFPGDLVNHLVEHFCDACAERMRASVFAKWSSLWANLPELMGLIDE